MELISFLREHKDEENNDPACWGCGRSGVRVGGGSAQQERRELVTEIICGVKITSMPEKSKGIISCKLGSSHLVGGNVVASETLKGCSCDGCTWRALQTSRGWLILGWSSFHPRCPVKQNGTSSKYNSRVQFISLFDSRPYCPKLLQMVQKLFYNNKLVRHLIFAPLTHG